MTTACRDMPLNSCTEIETNRIFGCCGSTRKSCFVILASLPPPPPPPPLAQDPSPTLPCALLCPLRRGLSQPSSVRPASSRPSVSSCPSCLPVRTPVAVKSKLGNKKTSLPPTTSPLLEAAKSTTGVLQRWHYASSRNTARQHRLEGKRVTSEETLMGGARRLDTACFRVLKKEKQTKMV